MSQRVLFVCVENSNRSQMAEAFARIHGEGLMEPASAGSRPSGAVNPRAIEAMRELGYDMSTHRSKSLEEVPAGVYDLVVTMGCGDDCPMTPALRREDWELPDPRDMDMSALRGVRDEIEQRVLDLVEQARA